MEHSDPGRWINAREAARLLGLPDTVFAHLLRRGVIPPPVELTRKTKMWPEATIRATGVLLPHLRRLAGENLPESEDVSSQKRSPK